MFLDARSGSVTSRYKPIQLIKCSVIARTTQYTLAESTRTLNLIDTTRSDVGEDALWLGCGSMDKSEGICDVGALQIFT